MVIRMILLCNSGPSYSRTDLLDSLNAVFLYLRRRSRLMTSRVISPPVLQPALFIIHYVF